MNARIEVPFEEFLEPRPIVTAETATKSPDGAPRTAPSHNARRHVSAMPWVRTPDTEQRISRRLRVAPDGPPDVHA